MKNPQPKYYVYYGECTSRFSAYNWREACEFMLHCLREGTKVTSVTKA